MRTPPDIERLGRLEKFASCVPLQDGVLFARFSVFSRPENAYAAERSADGITRMFFCAARNAVAVASRCATLGSMEVPVFIDVLGEQMRGGVRLVLMRLEKTDSCRMERHPGDEMLLPGFSGLILSPGAESSTSKLNIFVHHHHL